MTTKTHPQHELPAFLPWRTLLLAATAILIHLIPNAAHSLQYDRAALLEGRLGCLFTCHLAHWSAHHLLWDVLMFVVLGAITERRSPKAWSQSIAFSAMLIPAAIAFALPGITTYRGLSGIDSALMGLAATDFLLERRNSSPRSLGWTVGLIAFMAIGLKIIHEATTGQAIFVPSTTEIPIPLAHLVGAVCGVVVRMGLGSSHDAKNVETGLTQAMRQSNLIERSV